MEYRREIDGLRALAVMPVMLFHAGFDLFRGGFVGVDVFFVISGYLITTIILAEQERGEFSLKTFYERRARRILPALYLVMFVCVPFAWLWLMPADFRDFSKSLRYVAGFLSNVLFYKQSGYFDSASELRPLLHTWSLAVEEQYYVLFPLLLIVMWQLGRQWILGLMVCIAVISLGLAKWYSLNDAAAGFYLLSARAWELMIGGFIAFYAFYLRTDKDLAIPHRFAAESLALVGLSLICLAIFWFDETVPFPGFSALIPTLGAALIILFASPRTLVGRILGSKFFVGIGLISYSAYLWHQPLFAFARHRSLTAPGTTTYLSLLLAAVALAYVSWRYVEKPFRTRGLISRRQVAVFGISGAVLLVSFDLMIRRGLLEQPLTGAEKKIMTFENFVNPKKKPCNNPDVTTGLPIDRCARKGPLASNVLLWGDSHADAIQEELESALKGRQRGLGVFTHNGCAPVTGLSRRPRELSGDCMRMNELVSAYARSPDSEKYVVLLARWTFNLEGSRFDNREGGVAPGGNVALYPVDESEYSEDERKQIVAGRYRKEIEELIASGKTVVLVYPVPEAGWHVPHYLLRLIRKYEKRALDPSDGATSYSVFKERNRGAIDALDRVRDHPNLIRIRPDEILCDTFLKGRCITQLHGVPLYRDSHHLSNTGARLIASEIVRRIDGKRID